MVISDEYRHAFCQKLMHQRLALTCASSHLQWSGLVVKAVDGIAIAEADFLERPDPVGQCLGIGYNPRHEIVFANLVQPIAAGLVAVALQSRPKVTPTPFPLSCLREKLTATLDPTGVKLPLVISAAGFDGFAYDAPYPLNAEGSHLFFLHDEGRNVPFMGSVVREKINGKAFSGIVRITEIDRLPGIFWHRVVKYG